MSSFRLFVITSFFK